MLRRRSGGAVQSEEYGPCNVALPHARRRDRAPLGQWTYHLRIGLDRTQICGAVPSSSASARSASLGEMRSQSSNADCRVEATEQMRPLRVTRSDEWMMKNWRPSTNI